MRAIFLVLLIGNIGFFLHQVLIVEKTNNLVQAQPNKSSVTADKGLQLLSEASVKPARRDSISSPTGESVIPLADEAAVNAESGPLCTMIGPYEQLLHAEYLIERLSALDINAKIKPLEIKQGDSHWVYLPPEISDKEALRRLYELQSKQIQSHVITEGELKNGISLGRYADKADADIRLYEIKTQGYEPQIKTFPKTISEIWVVVQSEDAEKIDETAWSDLLNHQQGLEKRQIFCLGVASD